MSEISTAVSILVPDGAVMLAGDQFFDVDFGKWVSVPTRLVGKPVGKHDVVKRPTFNLASLVGQFIALLDGAPESVSKAGNGWWSQIEATVREAKRRLGMKTIDDYQRD